MILLSEFAGALLGVFWAWLVLMPSYIEGDYHKIPAQWITPLCPVGVSDLGIVEQPCDLDMNRDRSAFFFQVFGTFLFMFVILNIKDKVTSPTQDGVLGALAVSLSLFAMINLSALQGGAAYNPAVALAQLTFGIAMTSSALHDSQIHYLWVFLLAPFVGSLMAAIAQTFHARSTAKMAEQSSNMSEHKHHLV